MPPKKKKVCEPEIEDLGELFDHTSSWHKFEDADEIKNIRSSLLSWYDVNHRVLPWRRSPEGTKGAEDPAGAPRDQDPNIRGYAVWVSEIMLQQTRVQAVIGYYQKWMKRFPTVQDLASASLEEVNEYWTGLGFYRRARMLHEGAKMVVDTMKGVLPHTAAELSKIPGVGPYTAGAISSIAYGQTEPLVDGNVIRVLSRVRAFAGDPKNAKVNKFHWELAKCLVHPERPGDLNQALMELGATVCTPQSPSCDTCPVNQFCRARQETTTSPKIAKSESSPTSSDSRSDPDRGGDESAPGKCEICVEHGIPSVPRRGGVTDYPPKAKKAAVREECLAVGVIRATPEKSGEPKFLVVQRPETGLLAGLWEFPNVILEDEEVTETKRIKILDSHMNKKLGLSIELDRVTVREHVGDATHLFSHIKQKLLVQKLLIEGGELPEIETEAKKGDCEEGEEVEETHKTKKAKASKGKKKKPEEEEEDWKPPFKWVTLSELQNKIALPTQMKRVLDVFLASETPAVAAASGTKKRKSAAVAPMEEKGAKKQTLLSSFFGKS